MASASSKRITFIFGPVCILLLAMFSAKIYSKQAVDTCRTAREQQHRKKDEMSAQERSDATAKRLMVLTVGVVDAVVLNNQLFQVPVTDIDIWQNKLWKTHDSLET